MKKLRYDNYNDLKYIFIWEIVKNKLSGGICYVSDNSRAPSIPPPTPTLTSSGYWGLARLPLHLGLAAVLIFWA